MQLQENEGFFWYAYEKVPQLVGQLEKLPIFFIPWGHKAREPATDSL